MGVDYTGVDLSQAMLDQFAAHAQAQGLDVAGRLIAGDAANLDALPAARFARVMVPAFSLVLFEQSAREALFRSVLATLAPGGVFTAEIYTDTYYQDVFRGQQSICEWSPRDHGGYLVSFAEIRGNREEIRFLEQRLDAPPVLLHTWKWVYTSDQLIVRTCRRRIRDHRAPAISVPTRRVGHRPTSVAAGDHVARCRRFGLSIRDEQREEDDRLWRPVPAEAPRPRDSGDRN